MFLLDMTMGRVGSRFGSLHPGRSYKMRDGLEVEFLKGKDKKIKPNLIPSSFMGFEESRKKHVSIKYCKYVFNTDMCEPISILV